jgi:adenylate cyclase
MGADEVGTLKGLTERRAILDKAIAGHRGRIANTAGDSVLAEFGSAVDAVQCAVEAQAALVEVNASLPPDKRINFRIGIHVGDVMVRAGDLFGDGVNIAARLQTLASPGSACVSGATYEQVRKILPLSFNDLGMQQVKNIEEPVRAYSVTRRASATTSAVFESSKPLPLPDKPSIAVLPFQNMSGDPEQEYFADGIVEDITTALSRFRGLFVIARNSSFTYKGKAVDIKQVGRELGVRYVLEGSVRKAGGKLRINGQLIEAATGEHLWAERFDGSLEDIFDLQDVITERVVTFLVPKIRSAEIDRARRKRPESLDSYDSVLQALALLEKGTADDLRGALRCLERALQLAPDYALAHAMAAYVYARLFVAGANVDLESERLAAINLARKSIELSGDDPEVLAYASFALGNFEGDTSAFVERCVELNPNLSMGWFMLGANKLYGGDYDQALECESRAVRLGPVGRAKASAMALSALAYLLSDRPEQAYLAAERAHQESPDNAFPLRVLAMSAAAAGRRTRAHEIFQRFAPAAPKYLERVKWMLGTSSDSKAYEKVARAMNLASTPE